MVNQTGIIAKKQQEITESKEPKTLREYVVSMQGEIAKALPKTVTPERFTRIALTVLSSNPKLAKCDVKSFMGGLMQAAQLGLEPNTPLHQAYLIPFENRKLGIIEVQFQLGYKGMLDLAYRSGDILTIQAHCVYENDKFEYELGLDSTLKHVPAKENRGNMLYVYALFKLKNGGYAFEVMSKEDVIKHAKKYSQAYNSNFSPWSTNFEEMAKKTVLKRVLKYAPIKTELLQATIVDEGIVKVKEDDFTALDIEYSIIEEEKEEVEKS